MHRKVQQLTFDDFMFPYGELDQENEWVKLATIVPWEVAEREYAKQFVDNGAPAHPARIALGVYIIKQRLNCSDEWTVRHISETPYLQYFLGMKEYSSKCPFGASTMVEFRKRFPPETIAKLLDVTTPKPVKRNHNDKGKTSGDSGPKDTESSSGQEPPKNKGSLLMDATCCPADIAFPQDFQLLNDCRKYLEKIIGSFCKEHQLKHPRTRKNCARRDFLRVSKSKKRTVQLIRTGVRQQLQYIRRDIGLVVEIIRTNTLHLENKLSSLLDTLTLLYEQQLYMYENNKHTVPDRIVRIPQPWVRPIVRGKAYANTEFGPKLHTYGSHGRIYRVRPNQFFHFSGEIKRLLKAL